MPIPITRLHPGIVSSAWLLISGIIQPHPLTSRFARHRPPALPLVVLGARRQGSGHRPAPRALYSCALHLPVVGLPCRRHIGTTIDVAPAAMFLLRSVWQHDCRASARSQSSGAPDAVRALVSGRWPGWRWRDQPVGCEHGGASRRGTERIGCLMTPLPPPERDAPIDNSPAPDTLSTRERGGGGHEQAREHDEKGRARPGQALDADAVWQIPGDKIGPERTACSPPAKRAERAAAVPSNVGAWIGRPTARPCSASASK